MSTKGIDIATDVAALDELSKDNLIQRFGQLYGRPPPRYTQRALLLRAVAHRIQENAQGGPGLLWPAERYPEPVRRSGGDG